MLRLTNVVVQRGLRAAWGASLVVGAGVLIAHPVWAAAVSWPSNASFLEITGPAGIDPPGDAPTSRDIVGDANESAVQVTTDATHFFFRVRVNANPILQPGNFAQFGWACYMETDGDATSYEFVVGVDGVSNPDELRFAQNIVQGTPNSFNDPPELIISEVLSPLTAAQPHARVVPAPTNFSNNADFYIDFAVEIADLLDGGWDPSVPFRVTCGSSNNGVTIGSDTAGTNLENSWSEPTECEGGGCEVPPDADGDGIPNDDDNCPLTPNPGQADVDDDGIGDACEDSDDDGIIDQEEGEIDSDPLDADTDDDGVIDGEERDYADDTDNDGDINVLDTDSDGDGLLDGTETGSVCGHVDTDPLVCVPDGDGAVTVTDMLLIDTDGGTVSDGIEDTDLDGEIDAGERDPNDPSDDLECTTDAQCGVDDDGLVCDTAVTTCVPGCRNQVGSLCPAGFTCTSVDLTIGDCIPDGAGGGGGAGGGDGGGGGAGGDGGASSVTVTVASSASASSSSVASTSVSASSSSAASTSASASSSSAASTSASGSSSASASSSTSGSSSSASGSSGSGVTSSASVSGSSGSGDTSSGQGGDGGAGVGGDGGAGVGGDGGAGVGGDGGAGVGGDGGAVGVGGDGGAGVGGDGGAGVGGDGGAGVGGAGGSSGDGGAGGSSGDGGAGGSGQGGDGEGGDEGDGGDGASDAGSTSATSPSTTATSGGPSGGSTESSGTDGASFLPSGGGCSCVAAGSTSDGDEGPLAALGALALAVAASARRRRR